ncbi:MAG: diguanylate cyclase, partial [Myxococcales bacterium]|nr:diguanylate cyclase [Myxococcales bacterium]
FEALSEPAYLLEVEPGGRFRIAAINRACARGTGLQESEIVGSYVDDMGGDAASSIVHYRQALQSGKPIQYERSVPTPDGTIHLEVTASPIVNLLGDCTHLLCITKDVTRISNAEAEAARMAHLNRSVIDALPGPLGVIDAQGKIISRNSAWCEVAERNPETCWSAEKGESFLESLNTYSTQKDTALLEGITDVLAGTRPSFEGEHAQEGTWWRCGVVPLLGCEGGAVVTFTDITESKTTEAELSHAATHDHLTGLPNRDLFFRKLDDALMRPDSHVAVAFVDVDGFKAVNDELGHGAGDRLLCEIAERLKQVVRGGDTVARYAGDEFVILLSGFRGPERLEECGTRIIDAFTEPFVLDERELSVGVSVGLA